MNPFPDTSFLYSLYRAQVHSSRADAAMKALSGPLPASSLLLLEFRQSIRLQIQLNTQDATRGFPKREGTAMLRDFQSDLAAHALEVVPVDWADTHRIADGLSAKHTEIMGHRLIDILHVATALHIGAPDFLTFDANQKRLAEAEGLRVPV